MAVGNGPPFMVEKISLRAGLEPGTARLWASAQSIELPVLLKVWVKSEYVKLEFYTDIC